MLINFMINNFPPVLKYFRKNCYIKIFNKVISNINFILKFRTVFADSAMFIIFY